MKGVRKERRGTSRTVNRIQRGVHAKFTSPHQAFCVGVRRRTTYRPPPPPMVDSLARTVCKPTFSFSSCSMRITLYCSVLDSTACSAPLHIIFSAAGVYYCITILMGRGSAEKSTFNVQADQTSRPHDTWLIHPIANNAGNPHRNCTLSIKTLVQHL